ncbi:hypothetical protein MASR2M18_07540 [Ignavibacteria bacterium]|nr:F0F1 ATP synthase subunit B [Bacteroidota bacterium]MCZ2132724.1 F0F1 ATP synthase subunit B [Bacteroidota bacterium]
MENLLQISPGLMIWTLINFGVFFFIFGKFGFKPMIAALKSREDAIAASIAEAEAQNAEAKRLFEENRRRIADAQNEIAAMVKEGKERAERHIHAAQEEAERLKKAKVEESLRQIAQEKDAALASLRGEVASLVIEATSKILGAKIDAEQNRALIETYISQISKN